ncbi:MAG: hypothetical protein ABS87_10370 [Sphingomonas sp. SCN 67-18]|nr:PEPxxWA-CTERM sorting domain-containing protein [Sphingomonas sp. SCN 67-18]ODU20445.1 MAG: hypothetical protein ABS87_10370 [Sphingomonas sp. SCN 67-18]
MNWIGFSSRVALTGLAGFAASAALAAPVYLNKDNITVKLGSSHDAAVAANPTYGPFNDVKIADALENIIDAPTATALENHSSGGNGTHIWVIGTPLELEFDFLAEYDLTTLHFWNYYTEQYDVDSILFTFYDASRTLVGSLEEEPRLGNMTSGGPIIPEHYTLNFPSRVRYVNAVLKGSNGHVDYNNIGFTAELSPPLNAVPEPASWAMLIAGFGLAGSAIRRRRAGGRMVTA